MTFLQQVKDFVAGRPVEGAHPAITMFATCSRMKWNHLPVPGGIYDQDPELLRRWRIIWEAQDDRERAEQARQKREREQQQRQRGRGASRSRR